LVFMDCHFGSPDFGAGWLEFQSVVVAGKGTGICTGWYVTEGYAGYYWMHASKLRDFESTVATPTPTPVPRPTLPPPPSP
jgi:hypothetical protein